MTGSVTYGRGVTHRQFTANESTSSDLAASGRDRLIGTGTRSEGSAVEREENAEECWISLRLGRSVALLLHYFAIPLATSYFSSAPELLELFQSRSFTRSCRNLNLLKVRIKV